MKMSALSMLEMAGHSRFSAAPRSVDGRSHVVRYCEPTKPGENREESSGGAKVEFIARFAPPGDANIR
jgi:hypothetical protein